MLNKVEQRIASLETERAAIEAEAEARTERARLFVEQHNDIMRTLTIRTSEIDGALEELRALLGEFDEGAGQAGEPERAEDKGEK